VPLASVMVITTTPRGGHVGSRTRLGRLGRGPRCHSACRSREDGAPRRSRVGGPLSFRVATSSVWRRGVGAKTYTERDSIPIHLMGEAGVTEIASADPGPSLVPAKA
jgi:hypothetical protein